MTEADLVGDIGEGAVPDDGLLQKVVADVSQLPTLSAVAAELLDLLGDPTSSVKDLDRVMRRDTSLSATILKVVNSSYYGVRKRVGSLSHALALLGYRTVKNVVLTASAAGMFKCRSRCDGFDMTTFARHSVAMAAVCRYLANYTGRIEPEVAYTIGLLHDIGKLVADQCFPERYAEAMKLARETKRHVHECETQQWGYKHASVGAALGERWKLPQLVTTITRLHHSTALDSEGLLAVCRVADYICYMKQYAAPDNVVEIPIDRAAWESLHLHKSALGQMLAGLTQEIKDAEEMFNAAAVA